jgi:hypothetical protein
MEKRTKDNPWKLKTPPGTAEYTMHIEEKDGKEVLVCTVGKTVLLYDIRCITDLHTMLKKHGDWMDLGGADEQKPAKEGTVEAWGRSEKNPCERLVRFEEGIAWPLRCVPAAVDGSAGLAEVTHEAKGNRMRAK